MLNEYLGELNNISVFNEDIFNKSIDIDSGAYKIIIEAEGSRTLSKADEGIAIQGVLSNGVSLQSIANWGEFELDSALGNIVSNSPLLNIIKETAKVSMTVTGVNAETDLQSKKFYTGGSHLTLPINFKILDDDNSGKAIKAAMLLFSLSMPRSHSSIKLKDAFKGITKSVPDKALQDLINFGKDIENGIKGMNNNDVNNLNSIVKKGFNEIVNEELRLTESPPTVKISIGNWLILENMVIDSVVTNFASQSSESGPMSVEIDMQVSSRYKMILSEDGIKRVTLTSNRNRVTISKSKNTNIFA